MSLFPTAHGVQQFLSFFQNNQGNIIDQRCTVHVRSNVGGALSAATCPERSRREVW